MNDLQKYFEYLDRLRASGVTNMFGSSTYVERHFDISIKAADQIVVKWMETFDEEKTIEERVKAAS